MGRSKLYIIYKLYIKIKRKISVAFLPRVQNATSTCEITAYNGIVSYIL